MIPERDADQELIEGVLEHVGTLVIGAIIVLIMLIAATFAQATAIANDEWGRALNALEEMSS